MTKKEKELLLKELCTRLPYGVIGLYSWKANKPVNRELVGSLYDELSSSWSSTEDSNFLPYLRPMSSMTEKEKREFDDFCVIDEFVWKGDSEIGYKNQAIIMSNAIDWLNEKMFDYRGLIPMGIALPAPEGMYNLKKQ